MALSERLNMDGLLEWTGIHNQVFETPKNALKQAHPVKGAAAPQPNHSHTYYSESAIASYHLRKANVIGNRSPRAFQP